MTTQPKDADRRGPPADPEARVAVVTGAARGIGQAVVQGLASRGWKVAATDLEVEMDAGEGVLPRVMDVTDRAGIEDAAREIEEALGRVDLLVNNAGCFAQTPALSLDEQTMWRLLNVNLCGALRCTAVFGEIMARQGGGRIINVASISGLTGAALGSVYAASKAGMIAATRSAARELAGQGVRLAAVVPGFCDTPMLEPQRAMVEQFVVPRIPLGRVAAPEEVAEVILFLATCETDYFTGSVLTLDGGISVG